jgi:hypothetical protein
MGIKILSESHPRESEPWKAVLSKKSIFYIQKSSGKFSIVKPSMELETWNLHYEQKSSIKSVKRLGINPSGVIEE